MLCGVKLSASKSLASGGDSQRRRVLSTRSDAQGRLGCLPWEVRKQLRVKMAVISDRIDAVSYLGLAVLSSQV